MFRQVNDQEACSFLEMSNGFYKRFPTLIIEVLSESTEAFDRGDKFAESFGCGFASPKPFQEADYQEVASLREYVLISTKRQRVDCFRRGGQGLWVLQSSRPEGTSFRLNSVNFEGEIAGLYEDVTLG